MQQPRDTEKTPKPSAPPIPSLSLPKGGGAIRGMGEKFGANPVNGTGSMEVPLGTSPGRSGFGPQLSLSYDSGAGNGPFGFGWNLSIPAITRKTDKGLPQYRDADESDVYILSGAEDLVPVLRADDSRFEDNTTAAGYTIHRYRPRIEGLFARIERWTKNGTGEVFWRSITRDNVTSVYGKTGNSRISDPADPKRIFTWLISESYDDKGNAIVYKYVEENDQGIDCTQANERNRVRTAKRYLKRIKYGNLKPNRDDEWKATDLSQLSDWMFEVVFDYGESHYEDIDLDEAPLEAEQHRFVHVSSTPGHPWAVRPDPFSSYRAGFEVRTYRRCRRVLMFHYFDELGVEPCLVRSTEFEYADLDYDEQDPKIGVELAHQGSTRFGSFIHSITRSGFVRDETRGVLERNGVKYVTYLKKSMPPLGFEYTKAIINEDIRALDNDSLENLPVGLDNATYQWVDLDGEGISGILTEQADAWYYKRNLSPVNQVREDGKKCTKVQFGPLELVAVKPSPPLGSGQTQFMDLAGDGQLDLVELTGSNPGFYERTHDEDWESFKPFAALPNIAWDDPNVRFVDLNGDGHADVLITEDDVFTWYPSLAEEGFGSARRMHQPSDEERGPRLVVADGMQSIYLADMCGDGLTDIVRIRNGEVCYWPSLGYGFGAKVTMDNAPVFDSPDQFNQRRIRLADIDGSGTNDIIYLGRDSVSLYFNQCGNRWSEPHQLSQFPCPDNLSSVTTADLLGNGTACLVWSSPLPGVTAKPMNYIDLMGGRKPHLLVKTVNNLGAETHVQYAPSTKFYLADKLAGKPWVTKVPFPVHVVERVETYDRISRNRFVTKYNYHHGYFDGPEREFRGFGRVDQWDTEEFAALEADGLLDDATNLDEASHVPPVLTKTWFHTGAYLGRNHVSDFFAGFLNEGDVGEYYREPDLTDDQARELLLEDTVLPEGLTIEEEREACRALKGSMLRQEVYALDGTDNKEHPYTVTEQNFTVRCVQPKAGNRHAVFFTHPRESLNYHYERSLVPVLNGQRVDEATAETNPNVEWLPDPRVTHALTLDVDEFGNVLKSAAVGYGRRQPDPALELRDQAIQSELLITCTENRVTYPLDTADDYRTPLPCESRTYELTGYEPAATAERFQTSDFVRPDPNDSNALIHIYDNELNYEENPTGGKQRRLIEHLRTLYRKDDLTDLLALRELGSLALPGETYKLAFTPGLLAQVYRRSQDGQPPEDLLPDPTAVLPVDETTGRATDRGGYLSSQTLRSKGLFPADTSEPYWTPSDRDDHWWIPAGRVFYSPASNDTPAAELVHARRHFFLPRRHRDPFHAGAGSTEGFSTEALVNYDAYDLLVAETGDAVGNVVTVETEDDAGTTATRIDYRVLQPSWVTDPNGNRSQVSFDALGMVVGTAVMGKPGENLGDSLDDFEADLTESVTQRHITDPLANPHAILGTATTRMIYDLFSYYRTKDHAEPQPAAVYTMAREIHEADLADGQKAKVQHSFSYSDGFGREIQKKVQAEPEKINGVAGPPRWVCSGWTVFNNKGKPVRQYEPFFVDTPRYEFNVRLGVSPILLYDPAERVVAALHPNHTWEKVTFDPWQQESWDVNDVVTLNPVTDEDVKGFFVKADGSPRLPEEEYLPTWHALRTDPAHAAEASEKWPDPRVYDAEKRAAEKAAVHAETPTVTYFDSLGRAFLTVAHNKYKYGGTPPGDPATEKFYSTRVVFDVEGNQREFVDAKDRVVMFYGYHMAGPEEDEVGEETQDTHRIYQRSMDAGERWILNDAVGNPLRAWDSRGHQFETEYDELRRPVRKYVRGNDAESSDPGTLGRNVLAEKTEYGEGQPNDVVLNLRTRVFKHYDEAGVVVNADRNPDTGEYEAYDFKGNLLRSTRQLAEDYKGVPDWSGAMPPGANFYRSSTTYDALNRPVTQSTPDDTLIRFSYNETNLLKRVEANLRGAGAATTFVAGIDYDAKGRRTLIDYGNGVRIAYKYDPDTFRLTRLLTTRGRQVGAECMPREDPRQCEDPPAICADLQALTCVLQNLFYTYDPVGNITHIRDDAQQAIYFRNRRVEPNAGYTYDAIYRLIEATGREHLGQAGKPTAPDASNRFHTRLDHPGDGNAMGTYVERYKYDEVGNILERRHWGDGLASNGWKRCYQYAFDSNRLLSTGNPNDPHDPEVPCPSHYALTPTYAEKYEYDVHGNMTMMPGLPTMRWDYRDQLLATARQVVNNGGTPETTYYVYDAGGQRVRKVTDRQATAGAKPKRMKERIYLGGFEIYREYESDGETIKLERETVHVMDDQRRIALAETKTVERGNRVDTPVPLQRYQFGNHLGSTTLELDDQARIISYEEFTPYGSTSYQAVRDQTESFKRYRYAGKERDEETGLSYHGARYYAPWLGRWTAADPAGLTDNPNVYSYVRGNPTKYIDSTGNGAITVEQLERIREKTAKRAAALKIKLAKNYHGSRSEALAVARQAKYELVALEETGFWESLNPFVSIPNLFREVSAKTRLARAKHDLTPVEWRTADLSYAPTVTALTEQIAMVGAGGVTGTVPAGAAVKKGVSKLATSGVSKSLATRGSAKKISKEAFSDVYEKVAPRAEIDPRKVKRSTNLNDIMGGKASDLMGREDAVHFHLRAASHGGRDVPGNIIQTSGGANAAIAKFENALTAAARLGKKVETEIRATARKGTDVAESVSYKAWIDGEMVLDVTIDARMAPLGPGHKWWGSRNPTQLMNAAEKLVR